MIAERISDHVAAAARARHWLRERGAEVEGERFFMCRPLLEITCPPAELVSCADRIVESYNGGTRSVWVASVQDCRVIWR
ncbi:hypothetical protein JSX99_14820 [Klebsiella pneumoniae]|nr:hypothetical protein [Klebsiella pneumoniae]